MLKSKVTLLSEAITLLIIILISTYALTFSYAMQLTLGLFAAYLIPRFCYTRLAHYNQFGHLVLLAVWLILSALSIDYIDRATLSGRLPLSNPQLWGDAQRYFNFTLKLHYGVSMSGNEHLPFPGLSILALATWKLFGVSIIPPVAANVSLTLGTVILTGSFSRQLLHGKTSQHDSWIASMAMMLTASLFFFLSHCVQFLKEPLMAFALALCALVIARCITAKTSSLRWKATQVAIFAAGALLVAACRTTYTPFVCVGAMLCLFHRRARFTALAMMAVATVAYIAVDQLSHSISITNYNYYVDTQAADSMANQFIIGSTQIPYYNLIGDYFTYPWWKKVLLLPFTSMVQFAIPFPWLFSEVTLSNVFPRIAVGAYVVGGLALFYIFFLSWKRNTSIGIWTIWAIFCFIVPAYIVAGSVSRYVAPLQPLFVPMAIYVLALVKEKKYRKNFLIFALCYAIILISALCACYQAQAQILQSAA